MYLDITNKCQQVTERLERKLKMNAIQADEDKIYVLVVLSRYVCLLLCF